MIICNACGGTIEELGELPNYDNPCTCRENKMIMSLTEIEVFIDRAITALEYKSHNDCLIHLNMVIIKLQNMKTFFKQTGGINGRE